MFCTKNKLCMVCACALLHVCDREGGKEEKHLCYLCVKPSSCFKASNCTCISFWLWAIC
uniref:Uncharacterized protein n=1 Tax=Arundo donax TaxID=35708 RepID=A0A0A9AW35_ARUDO